MNFAKILLLSLSLFFALAMSADAQWVKQSVNTTASLRGLSVVNEKVIWASGTGGTVIRTIDGSKTWDVITVPGAEKLDFRDIEAFDADTAYILSIGNGESSRIYKTTDGGKTWNLQFKNTNEKAFFDAIACWDRNNCVAISDPVDRNFILIDTNNGGSTWPSLPRLTYANNSEVAFAASGTCLITPRRNYIYYVTGGSTSEVNFSSNRGNASWEGTSTPIAKGIPGTGIFSIAMFDAKNGVIVGGSYEKPDEAKNNLAFTNDGGKNWTLGSGLSGYRSGVTYVNKKTIIAVGTNGSDVTRDGGKTWKKLGDENLNAVQAKGKRSVWAVGAKGLVVRYYFLPNPLKLVKLNQV